MSFCEKIKDVLGMSPSSWTHPDKVKVSPAAYGAKVRNCFWQAVAKLEGKGAGWGHRHNIQNVDIRPGTVRRDRGWALPCKASPTGFAGGWREGKRLVIVCDPATGHVQDGVIVHDWSHVILDFDGKTKCYGMDKQHELMARAGI